MVSLFSYNFPPWWIFTLTILLEPYMSYPFSVPFTSPLCESRLDSARCYAFACYPLYFCHPFILPWCLSYASYLKTFPPPISIWEWCFTYLTLGHILFFTACKPCLNSILCCTCTLGSSMPLSLLLHHCLLSPLTHAIFMSLPRCLLWTYPLKPPLFQPSSRVLFYLSRSWLFPFPLSRCKSCLTLTPFFVELLFDISFTFVIFRSYLGAYLMSIFDTSSFPSQFVNCVLPILPLVVSSSLRLQFLL